MANEEQKAMSDKPAEQAYHARGAGNGEPKCHCTMDVTEHCRFHGHIQFATRNPGADTGTTVAEELSGMLAERMIKLAIKIQGPYAIFGPPESLERRKKSHQERIEELTGMLTTEFAECLERGTTPPDEWLALERAANWFEERGGKWDAEFIATQLRALAATQRAPVEQVQPAVANIDLPRNEFEAAWAHYASTAPGTATEKNVFMAGWNAAAPDHAREGALLREAKWWYKEFVWPWRADDEDSDDRARKRLAALADGKEGTLR